VTLFPVILPVIEDINKLPGKEKVALLSRVSREALKLSAEKGGVIVGELYKDENDVPIPFSNSNSIPCSLLWGTGRWGSKGAQHPLGQGRGQYPARGAGSPQNRRFCGVYYYWSVSHKPKYVAAVISNDKIGIDIEEIKPRSESLFSYVATSEEWELSQEKSWDALFRYWTAKEATLKAIGIGISGLKTCRIISVPDEGHIILRYQNRLFEVEQLRYKGHIVSILKDKKQIEWIIPKDSRPSGEMYP
jgi:4'-phosphopantetheinyl transferase